MLKRFLVFGVVGVAIETIACGTHRDLSACAAPFDSIGVGSIDPQIPSSFSVDNGSFNKRAIYLSDQLDACRALHADETTMQYRFDTLHQVVIVVPLVVGSYPLSMDVRVVTYYWDKQKPKTGGELRATRGTVTIANVVDGKRITGAIDVYFDATNGSSHVSGKFDALFCIEPMPYAQFNCIDA